MNIIYLLLFVIIIIRLLLITYVTELNDFLISADCDFFNFVLFKQYDVNMYNKLCLDMIRELEMRRKIEMTTMIRFAMALGMNEYLYICICLFFWTNEWANIIIYLY